MTTETKLKPVSKAVRTSCERAADTFMTFPFRAGKPTCTMSLPAWAKEELLAQAAANANSGEEVDPDSIGTQVYLFGNHQQLYKDCCINPVARFRLKLEEDCFRANQNTASDYVIEAINVPERYYGEGTKAEGYVEAVERMKGLHAEFFENYEEHKQAGIDAAVRNFPYAIYDPRRKIHTTVAEMVKAKQPKKEDLQAALYIQLGNENGDPEMLSVFDAKRKLAVPPGYMDRFERSANASTVAMMEGLKAKTIEACTEAMTALASITGKGRLTEAKIEEALRTTRRMRVITEGWDNRKQLLAVADIVEQRIGEAVKDFGVFAEDDEARAQVARAADAVRKQLDKISGKAKPKTAKKKAAKKAATPKPKAPPKAKAKTPAKKKATTKRPAKGKAPQQGKPAAGLFAQL